MKRFGMWMKAAAFSMAIVGMGLTAYAKKPGGGGGGTDPDKCPRDVLCPDVMDPVICSDGNVYANACYAYQQCATDCVPTGDI